MSRNSISVFASIVFIVFMPEMAFPRIQISGDCSVNIADIGGEAEVNVTLNTCGDDLRVTYFWLDGQTITLLQNGVMTPRMELALGKKPKILRFGVHDELQEILEIGSERVTGEAFINGFSSNLENQSGASTEPSYNELSLDRNPEVRRKINRVWFGDEFIPWPEPSAIKQFYSDGVWPQDFAYCYPASDPRLWVLEEFREALGPDGSPDGLAARAASTPSITAIISQNEFSGFFTNVRKHAELVRTPPTDANLWDLESGEIILHGAEITRENWLEAVPPSFQLIQHLTQRGQPDDFLVKVGEYIDVRCSGALGLSFALQPRTMQVLVALIEPISPSIRIIELGLHEDSAPELRPAVDPDTPSVIDASLPTLVPGESYVLPLRLEWHYEPKEAECEQFYRLVRELRERFPKALGAPSAGEPLGASQTLLGMREPEILPVEPIYYFGPAFSLSSITTHN